MQEDTYKYIYEGYFNDTEASSDDIVKDVESTVTSNESSSDYFSTCYTLYIIQSKIEDVLKNVNFKRYFENINRVYDSMTIFNAEDDMDIEVKYCTDIIKDNFDLKFSMNDILSNKFLDDFINSTEQYADAYVNHPILSIGNPQKKNTVAPIELKMTVPVSINKKPSFEKFVREIKRLVSAVYPLFSSLQAISSSNYTLDNKAYFSWEIDGSLNDFGKTEAFHMTEWKYKGYQNFYNKFYKSNESFFSDEVGSDLYKKQSKIVSGSFSVNKLFRICHRLQFSDVNEKEYGYELAGYYDGGQGSHRDIYIKLMPMKPEYSVLSKMVQWIKDNIINHLSYADLIALIGADVLTTVNIYVAVMSNDKPVFDLNKSGKANKISGNQIVNEQQYIQYEITFLDPMWSKYDLKHKAYISKNCENAWLSHHNYTGDLESGAFGRNQTTLPNTYFTDLKDKIESQQDK